MITSLRIEIEGRNVRLDCRYCPCTDDYGYCIAIGQVCAVQKASVKDKKVTYTLTLSYLYRVLYKDTILCVV